MRGIAWLAEVVPAFQEGHCFTAIVIVIIIFVTSYCIILAAAHDTGVGSASNIYGGIGGRCIGLTTLQPSIVDRFEIWESQTPGARRVCPGLYRNSFTFYFLLLFKSQIITRNIKIKFKKRWLDSSACMKEKKGPSAKIIVSAWGHLRGKFLGGSTEFVCVCVCIQRWAG